MATGVNTYMEVMAQMTPEEKQQLLDSVKNYDTNIKNKILKAHLDAKAAQLGIIPTPTVRKPIDAGLTESTIANKAAIEKANPGMTVDTSGNIVPIVKKVGTLFKKPVAVQKTTYTLAPVGPTSAGPVVGSVGGETIDNKITNNLVDKGVLPEYEREIYPQGTVTVPQKKARYDKSIKDIAKSAVTPYTPEQMAKAEADNAGINRLIKSVLPRTYTAEDFAKAEANNAKINKALGKVPTFIKKLFTPYNFTEQVKNK